MNIHKRSIAAVLGIGLVSFTLSACAADMQKEHEMMEKKADDAMMMEKETMEHKAMDNKMMKDSMEKKDMMMDEKKMTMEKKEM